MKFVAIADEQICEIDDRANAMRVRVPRPVGAGDVVCLVLNSTSADVNGATRAELRVYNLSTAEGEYKRDIKIPPRYHFASALPAGAHVAMELRPFPHVLYTTEAPVPFMRLRALLAATPIEVAAVFSEFDRQIALAAQRKTLVVDASEAERLFERASKCRAKCLLTPFPREAELSFRAAVALLAQIIGLRGIQCA